MQGKASQVLFYRLRKGDGLLISHEKYRLSMDENGQRRVLLSAQDKFLCKVLRGAAAKGATFLETQTGICDA